MQRMLPIIVFSLLAVSAAAAEPQAVYGNGWIDKSGEYPVLHLKGSEEEMGKQFGYLAGDILAAQMVNLKKIGEANSSAVQYIPNFLFNGARRLIGAVYWTTYPKDIQIHIKGIVEGAQARPDKIKLHRLDLAFVNSIVDLIAVVNAIGVKLHVVPALTDLIKFLGLPAIQTNCDSMAVWGPRTVGGKTFQNRNTDIGTGQGIERYPLMLVIKRDGAIPVVSQTFAGMLGVLAGMNAYGVGFGQVWTYSNEIKLHMPWQLQLRETLMSARNAREAVMTFGRMGNTGYGSNFVFADAGAGGDGSDSEGFSVETNANQFVVFEPNDPRELDAKWHGQVYGLPLSYSVMRGDVALDPTIRSQQVACNGPTGDPRAAGSYQDRYQGLYDRILAYEKSGTLMGKNEAIAISKETAIKDSNLMDAVYANTDRDMWITFAKINADGSETQAYSKEYENLPFYKFLSTLSYDSKVGRISIQSYMPEKKRDLSVKLLRDDRLLDDSVRFTADHEQLEISLREKPVKGDVLELRDEGSGELVDRLLVKE